jgi:hypothetical protein
VRKEIGECERGSRKKEGGRGCGKRKKLIVGVRGHGEKNATTSPGTCPEVRWGFHPIQKISTQDFLDGALGHSGQSVAHAGQKILHFPSPKLVF